MIDAAGILFVTGLPPHRRALFVRRTAEGDRAGLWALPGGKIEQGETPAGAALREAEEELGQPAPHRHLTLAARHRFGNVDYRTFLQRVSEKFEPELNEEHDDWVWAPLDEPPEPLHPGVRLVLPSPSNREGKRRQAMDARPPQPPRLQRRRIVSPTGKHKMLAPVRANSRLQSRYQAKLEAMVDAMHRSLMFWLRAQYRATPPVLLAADEEPAAALLRRMNKLGDQWERNFDRAAAELGTYFATESFSRSEQTLKAILRKAGISVKFQMTAAARDAMRATIGEQVGLIKSIPRQHLQEVQGLVMRSVTEGRDLGTLSNDLIARYHITRKRAALISLDQSNKSASVITRVRYLELGITQARWLHSRAGKEPREAHVAFSKGNYWGQNHGPIYNVAEGMIFHDRKGKVLDGGTVAPGWAIRCRCVARAIIPGFR